LDTVLSMTYYYRSRRSVELSSFINNNLKMDNVSGQSDDDLSSYEKYVQKAIILAQELT
jgi:hypothetical protein